jgi:DNA-binding MarR family transcriptional regulator
MRREADFTFLLRVTGLNNGNLSTHLTKLETAGLVTIVKQFAGKRPQTLVSVTEPGREQIKQHWRRQEKLRDQAGKLRDAEK